jgi:hypothetical protein
MAGPPICPPKTDVLQTCEAAGDDTFENAPVPAENLKPAAAILALSKWEFNRDRDTLCWSCKYVL